MAFKFADRVQETTITAGTGNIALGGAVTGFRTFAAALSTGDTCSYCISDPSTGDWEVGIGTFTAPSTLARTTVQSSSNGGAAVNLSAYQKNVFITLGAGNFSQTPGANQIPILDPSGLLILPSRIVGGFGASSSGGIQDWNDSSNILAGFGPWLLAGNATNGPNTSSALYHVMNLNYGAKDGSGSTTQIAIPYHYNSSHLYLRSRYQGAWSAWRQLPVSNLSGQIIIGGELPNISGAKLQTADGLTFPATQVPSADPNTQDDYREASFTVTATGMTTSPTSTAKFTRIGNQITMYIPTVSGISNATSFTLTGVPTTARPSSDARVCLVRVTDNGVDSIGLAAIYSSGTINLYVGENGGPFQASGTKGVKETAITYIL